MPRYSHFRGARAALALQHFVSGKQRFPGGKCCRASAESPAGFVTKRNGACRFSSPRAPKPLASGGRLRGDTWHCACLANGAGGFVRAFEKRYFQGDDNERKFVQFDVGG
jgi:hypothetical protein